MIEKFIFFGISLKFIFIKIKKLNSEQFKYIFEIVQ